MPIRFLALASLVLAGACTPGPQATALRPDARPPALEAITPDDLRRDLFKLAGDEMRGREAGTLDELRASVWLAQQAREAGLEPAGDDGTFYQFFDLRRNRLKANSTVSVGGTPLRLWDDVVPQAPVEVEVQAPVVMLDAARPMAEIAGKTVVAPLRPPSRIPRRDVSFWAWRTTNAAIREQVASLRDHRPAAIVLVADSIGEQAFGDLVHFLDDGQYLSPLDSGPQSGASPVPVFLVRSAIPGRLGIADGQQFRADLRTESFLYPSVNVVARVPGTDPVLRDEHVLFSGHQDHDGVGEPVAGDSIWNGADDNATASVALLAIGRAFRAQPGRRSALLVWHGAEEKGLHGSRWFSARPTVPKESIVAVLNADMIGRNHPDSAALLGATPPHRNSSELVEMAMEANRNTAGFLVDTSWDAPDHPEGWYFRSDHLPYARAGIPAIFFTSLLHPDYHTPRDEPERIDVEKLTRIARWMYATGWMAANADRRPALDPGFQLER